MLIVGNDGISGRLLLTNFLGSFFYALEFTDCCPLLCSLVITHEER